ncbi:protein-(glutamine-N5) methyltransferase, release factor-specific [Salinicola sp. MH3R3-1]|uniref:peptide chain release factor N(5)-glutamine methyltransferase n=1 Tax=Salinicola sp. MH3R3-1 TaxID=1928762 RepID=UPI00094E621E|nr:peptide chain release factor N(5)-glutamine methyltransferase [Salinicola sp. MH3R3-1]OLO09010.1 protein-(glutamine-N5) methyltransferase, release factor-specific [Salinicola sp. MH3R3-1]
MTIDDALREATARLSASPTPRLDAEVLLAHLCERSRTWLYTWGDRALTDDQTARFDALLERRGEGCPVAYLTGSREFWGLDIQTSPATLIPRPDTERLVEVALESAAAANGELLDLGTGTGAVALAFASERPGWQVTGVDRAADAVSLAQSNAERLAIANVRWLESDWFSALSGQRFDIIVANPPYIAADDPHLTRDDVRFEPRSALVAEAAGLSDLAWLARHASAYLKPEGWLWMEHGHTQAETVRNTLMHFGFLGVVSRQDLAGHERITGGQGPR